MRILKEAGYFDKAAGADEINHRKKEGTPRIISDAIEELIQTFVNKMYSKYLKKIKLTEHIISTFHFVVTNVLFVINLKV